jgi:hypothetical protein
MRSPRPSEVEEIFASEILMVCAHVGRLGASIRLPIFHAGFSICAAITCACRYGCSSRILCARCENAPNRDPASDSSQRATCTARIEIFEGSRSAAIATPHRIRESLARSGRSSSLRAGSMFGAFSQVVVLRQCESGETSVSARRNGEAEVDCNSFALVVLSVLMMPVWPRRS